MQHQFSINYFRSLASTACEGLATVHARVSSGTMIRPTIDELESAHREIYTAALVPLEAGA